MIDLLFLLFLIATIHFGCKLSIKNNKPIYVLYIYTFLAFLSAVRYDVGWDYAGYKKVMLQICDFGLTGDIASMIVASSGKVSEPFIFLLCYIFQCFEDPSIGIFASYSVLTIACIYIAVNGFSLKIDVQKNKWSLTAAVLFYFLFFMWDAVRQGLALSIILISYRYIENKNLFKFLICILIACTVHLSSFLALPLWFSDKVKIKNRTCVTIAIFFIFLYFLGVFSALDSLAKLVPYYSRYVEDSRYIAANTGFSVLGSLKFILWCLTLSVLPEDRIPVRNAFFVGVCLYIVGSGAQIFERIADYYYYSIILLFPDIIKYTINRQKLLILLLLATFICYYDMSITQKRGVVPYQTIWSDAYNKGIEKNHIDYD